jgi:hypothetical protein
MDQAFRVFEGLEAESGSPYLSAYGPRRTRPQLCEEWARLQSRHTVPATRKRRHSHLQGRSTGHPHRTADDKRLRAPGQPNIKQPPLFLPLAVLLLERRSKVDAWKNS